ncbi:putative HTH-type transcriptional regulator YqaE [Paenibacillus antibioticophila]|uniref:HTH-type transcriptional regulator YqaE n=1 Tax=Paenibacillus antibioticophila TaxID=1274374 RepID=A0A919XNY0_9BACL|nr:helix-turn-helix domain-containing protein [Paenibacillus antibioticophila]GIO36259.1 putative HTH-type transcriptional regulator YqaE [Paenibacillus antibioticophila]
MLNIDRLATMRLKKKLTHQNMADKLGITRQGYGNYESGKRDVDTETLVKISEILETNSAYLLGETDDPSPNKDASAVSREQAEFEAFINNPEHGIFFKDYLSAPEERREEMRIIFKALMEKEKGRKPGQRQGE